MAAQVPGRPTVTKEDPNQRAIETDNIVRANRFRERHPHVSILWPSQNDKNVFLATWIEASADPSADGNTMTASNPDLGQLMNYLEALFRDKQR